MITYRPTTAADVAAVAPRLREADKQEIWLATGCPAGFALEKSVRISAEVWTAVVDGTPECIFGYAVHPDGWAAPWMVGTDVVLKHQRELMRRGRLFVAELTRKFPTQANAVHVDNHRSIRWLKALGFTFAKSTAFGPFDATFIPFYKLNHV